MAARRQLRGEPPAHAQVAVVVDHLAEDVPQQGGLGRRRAHARDCPTGCALRLAGVVNKCAGIRRQSRFRHGNPTRFPDKLDENTVIRRHVRLHPPRERHQGPGRGHASGASICQRRARGLRRRLAVAGRNGGAAGRGRADAGHLRRREIRHHPQRLARHPLRPVDQPLPRLRTRLQLLLRAAHAQLPEPLAGAGFRDEDHRQAQHRRGAAPRTGRAALRAQPAQHRLGDRLLPARGARPAPDARGHRGHAGQPATRFR